MWQKYENEKIYLNLEKAKKFSKMSIRWIIILNLLLILLIAIIFWCNGKSFVKSIFELLFKNPSTVFIFLLWLNLHFNGPALVLKMKSNIEKPEKLFDLSDRKVQEKKYNDLAQTKKCCIWLFLSVGIFAVFAIGFFIFLIVSMFVFAAKGERAEGEEFVLSGLSTVVLSLLYIMAGEIFSCIAGGYMAQNYRLIKQAWEENPPVFYKPDWKKAEERAQLAEDRREEREAQKEEEHYRKQIEICGARFFIKYYRQAKRLPLRDVKVTENYSSAEREERLEAVRELIDSGQSEYALQRILEEYGDVLDDSEVQDAKALLAEIEKENHTEDEK